MTIGREIGNTIAPINVDGFSRHHARIFFKDGAWYVDDVGSTNGTYRNRVKVEAPTKIEKGDSIRCGLMELASFDFEESAAPATVTAAEPPKSVVPPKPIEPAKPQLKGPEDLTIQVQVTAPLGAKAWNEDFTKYDIFLQGEKLRRTGRTIKHNGYTYCEVQPEPKKYWVAVHDGDTQILDHRE